MEQNNALIENFHETVGGNFEVEFIIYQTENRTNVLGITSGSIVVGAKENEIVMGNSIIIGNEANLNVSCLSITSSVPSEEICE